MRKTGICMIGIMLAAVLLVPEVGLAWATDDFAAAVNLQAVVTANGSVKVTWDFPSFPYAVEISAVRSMTQVKADYQGSAYYPGNDCFFTPPEQNTYIIIMYYMLTPTTTWSDRATTLVHYETPFSPISLEVKDVNPSGMVTLKWKDVTSYETGWNISVTGVDSQMNPVSEVIPIRPNADSTAEVTVTSPLKPEGQYTFTVWAVNGCFAGPSASVSAVIKLKAPTNLTARAIRDGDLYVDLRWTANSNADYYEIERTNPDGSITEIITATDDVFWPDMDVRPMATYRYRVRAMYADRPDYTSNYSEEAVVATTEFHFATIAPIVSADPGTAVKPGASFKPGVLIEPTATATPRLRVKPGVILAPSATPKPSALPDLIPPAIRK